MPIRNKQPLWATFFFVKISLLLKSNKLWMWLISHYKAKLVSLMAEATIRFTDGTRGICMC